MVSDVYPIRTLVKALTTKYPSERDMEQRGKEFVWLVSRIDHAKTLTQYAKAEAKLSNWAKANPRYAELAISLFVEAKAASKSELETFRCNLIIIILGGKIS